MFDHGLDAAISSLAWKEALGARFRTAAPPRRGLRPHGQHAIKAPSAQSPAPRSLYVGISPVESSPALCPALHRRHNQCLTKPNHCSWNHCRPMTKAKSQPLSGTMVFTCLAPMRKARQSTRSGGKASVTLRRSTTSANAATGWLEVGTLPSIASLQFERPPDAHSKITFQLAMPLAWPFSLSADPA